MKLIQGILYIKVHYQAVDIEEFKEDLEELSSNPQQISFKLDEKLQ